ncbi:uncharacterized protein LOC115961119 [Quercus lobata]|uniref:uncharacterized protein LOC115961119 n=1 Tax=Quercus lobata TaxID=97700 RepID=UPI001247D708|nr:uncharacterized protein LOC115961119 [Quercus lobata]
MTESTSSATTHTAQPWENSSSPYFLSSGDNPGVSLVVQPLTEENYNTWSGAILISLDAKIKLEFIDGSIPKPQSVDHPYYIAWCKCNNTVLAWLFNSVSKDLQLSIVYFKTAKVVWIDLQYRTFTYGHQVEDYTMSFLMELNETCAVVRGQILLMDPMPPLSKVFSLILQDEKQRKVGAAKKMQIDTAAALPSVLAAKNVKNAKKGRPQCTH